MGKTNLCSFKSRKLLYFGEGVGLWLEESWEAFCGADNVLFLNTEAVFILWKTCIFMKCALFSMYITLKKINNKMWCIHTIEYYSVWKRNSATYYNTEAPGGHYAKWRKPVTEGLRLWFHIHEAPTGVNSQRQKPGQLPGAGKDFWRLAAEGCECT